MRFARRHGWQLPLHPLQIVGMAVHSFLVAVYYTFLGLLLGKKNAEIAITSIFSFVAFSVMFLFIRCAAIDPSDKTCSRKNKRGKSKRGLKLNYGFILRQIVMRFFRRMEMKILKTFIRRKYLDPLNTNVQMEPLLPFLLVTKDDAISPDLTEDDISYCPLCDFEVKRHSKHCRTCNRCTEGFDHHCKWLNNCVGKKNYTSFILLMVFVLLMLFMEGGTALAVFVRCFADKKGIEQELEKRLQLKFPQAVLPTISILLVLLTAYGSAAMGQLFFFHVVLIRKGMRTYDYILAMREENQFGSESDDLDSSSDESSDFDDLPEKSSLVSRCRGQNVIQNPSKLSIRIDKEPELEQKQGCFRVSINPWNLIKLSSEKALLAAEKARERLKPLPLENHDKNSANSVSDAAPFVSKVTLSGSPGRLSSPRRRFSVSPSVASSVVVPSPKQKYRRNFDLKLTEVSRELETYISRQVLCSVIPRDGIEASPR